MSSKPYPSQTQDRYIVRFPDGMRDQIAEAAKASNRSMNAEIIARLEASFDPPLPPRMDPNLQDFDAVAERVAAKIYEKYELSIAPKPKKQKEK